VRLLGNLLVVTSLLGLLLLGLLAAGLTPPWEVESRPVEALAAPSDLRGTIAPPTSAPILAAALTAAVTLAPTTDAAGRGADAPGTARLAVEPSQPRTAAAGGTSAPQLLPEPDRPIDRIAAPSIGLDAPVVAARVVKRGGAPTWEIPAYRAGHAEGTAPAGAKGNAVLLGHVDSLRSGDVFRHLEKVAVGDAITVWSGERAYTYRVVEAGAVDRADTATLGTTETATLTLVTCTGTWSPLLWDYTERFVVRAELSEASAG
jgi:LPXTG-site transpeptidase (sortase) family protein